jgi:hypothetical protein
VNFGACSISEGYLPSLTLQALINAARFPRRETYNIADGLDRWVE